MYVILKLYYVGNQGSQMAAIVQCERVAVNVL